MDFLIASTLVAGAASILAGTAKIWKDERHRRHTAVATPHPTLRLELDTSDPKAAAATLKRLAAALEDKSPIS